MRPVGVLTEKLSCVVLAVVRANSSEHAHLAMTQWVEWRTAVSLDWHSLACNSWGSKKSRDFLILERNNSTDTLTLVVKGHKVAAIVALFSSFEICNLFC